MRHERRSCAPIGHRAVRCKHANTRTRKTWHGKGEHVLFSYRRIRNVHQFAIKRGRNVRPDGEDAVRFVCSAETLERKSIGKNKSVFETRVRVKRGCFVRPVVEGASVGRASDRGKYKIAPSKKQTKMTRETAVRFRRENSSARSRIP